MKVLFYAPLSVLSYHHETDLELIKKHLDAGDDVRVIVCQGNLKSAGYSGCMGAFRCSFCYSRSLEGLRRVGIKDEQILTIEAKDAFDEIPSISHLQQLKNFEYKGADIGMSVASTLISYLREPAPDVVKYNRYIRKSLAKTVGIYKWFDDYFSKEKPDLLYFFNGRFTLYRPVLRAAQKHGVHFFVHERSGVLERYSLNENTYPHDLPYKKKEILEAGQGLSLQEKEKVATTWFEKRSGRKDNAWYTFTEGQTQGNLPEAIAHAKRIISIYISSQDEFEAISGWENPVFSDQAEGVRLIAEHFRGNSDFHFFVRIHPNLIGLRNSQVEAFEKLKTQKNVTIIGAAEDVDTYELMRRSEKVMTFGSTMGMEAVFHGKVSILVGRSLYEDLEGPYKPTSRQELFEMLDQDLTPKGKNGALAYGYWLATYGFDFKYFRPTGLSRGLFLGQEIKGKALFRYLSYVSYGFLQIGQVLKGELAMKVLMAKVRSKFLV